MLARLKPYAFATLVADITVAALVAMQPRARLLLERDEPKLNPNGNPAMSHCLGRAKLFKFHF
jgi:hypothetical protein